MAKVAIIDGVAHRVRRGKLVAIPEEWVGRHTTKKTIRQRKNRAAAKKTRGAQERKSN